MKGVRMNRQFIVASLLLVAVSLQGANPQDCRTNQAKPKAEQDYSQQQYLLKFRFPTGKYALSSKQDLAIGIAFDTPNGAQNKNITVSLAEWMTLDVSEPGDDGSATMDVRFTRLAQSFDAPNQKIALDTNDANSLSTDPTGEVLSNLLQKTVSLSLDSEQAPVDITEMDAMWATNDRSTPEQQALLERVKRRMGKGIMCQLLQQGAEMMPAEPVSAGHTWQVDTEVPVILSGKMIYKAEYELAKIRAIEGGHIATIKFNGTLAQKPQENLPQGHPLSNLSENVEVSGQTLILLELGLVLSTTTDVSGGLSMQVGKGTLQMSIKGKEETTISLAE